MYTLDLEADGRYHLRGYACNKSGDPAEQANHPSIEVYLDASVIYGFDGTVLPGSGTLIKSGTADQPGSTEDEARACGYTRRDSPPPAFWQNMRFDLAFTLAELGPIVGRSLYVVGAWHASATAVAYADLANNPRTGPALDLTAVTVVSCVASPTNPNPHEPVTFTATATGGTGAYLFAWADGEGRSAATGSTNQWTVTYGTPGLKSASVAVVDNSVEPRPGFAACPVTVVIDVNSALLPTARSVTPGTPASAFLSAVLVAAKEKEPATGCRIQADASASAGTLSYQETNAETNAPTGEANPTFVLAPLVARTFVVSLTMPGEFVPGEVELSVVCTSGAQSVRRPAINTLLLAVSATRAADVVAVSATPSADGIVRAAVNAPGAFSVAAVNVADVASGLGVFVADTSGLLPFDRLTICQTSPSDGQCLALPVPGGTLFTLAGRSTSQGSTGDRATFSVFISPTAAIPSDPERNRIVVTFRDFAGVVRGRTSVAITTEPPPTSP